MDHGPTRCGPTFLNDRRLPKVRYLLGNIDLNHSTESLLLVLDRVQLYFVNSVHVFDVSQPFVDQPKILVGEGVLHAATAVVTAHNHMFDLEDFDRILQNAQHVEVGVDHLIGDIAMDEQLPWRSSRDLFGRNPAIGAANPKIFRLLTSNEPLEKFRIYLKLLLHISFVGVE